MDRRHLLWGLLLVAVGCGNNTEQGGTVQRNSRFDCTFAEIKGHYLIQWKDGKTTAATAPDEETFVKTQLEPNASKILLAEPDYMITLDSSELSPADANDLQPNLVEENWGVKNIKASSAWNRGFYGQGIKVAVVDSGVDVNHPRLKNQIDVNRAEAQGTTGVDDDHNGLVDDIYGYDFSRETPSQVDEVAHGTHVAGIIAADHVNSAMLGTAPQAKLIPVDFMGENGGKTSDALRALDYAVARGAKVINASWGNTFCSQSLRTKFDDLHKLNVLIVVAAGNDAQNIGEWPSYPAYWQGPNQLTIAALDPSGYLAFYSNYGEPVHLLAPGSYVNSTVPLNKSPDGYGVKSGTSMAAPFVSGAAALLWSKKPSATAAEIRAAIVDSLANYPYSVQPRGQLRVDAGLDRL